MNTALRYAAHYVFDGPHAARAWRTLTRQHPTLLDSHAWRDIGGNLQICVRAEGDQLARLLTTLATDHDTVIRTTSDTRWVLLTANDVTVIVAAGVNVRRRKTRARGRLVGRAGRFGRP